MNNEKLTFLHFQLLIIDEAIRAVLTHRGLSSLGIENDAIKYLKTICYKQAITDWCKIFGAYSEKTHWRKLDLSREPVRAFDGAKLNSIAESNNCTWEEYYTAMRCLRDKFFSHFDIGLDALSTSAPSLEICLESLKAYRDWMIGCFFELESYYEGKETILIMKFLKTNELLEEIDLDLTILAKLKT